MSAGSLGPGELAHAALRGAAAAMALSAIRSRPRERS
jgi:hypothetical protein